MDIGYFTSRFPYKVEKNNVDYSCGGANLATYHLAAAIAKRGHAVDIFTTALSSNDSFESYDDLNIYRYGTNFRLLTSNISIGLFYKPLIQDVGIVHASFDIPPGPFAALLYAKKKKLPLIVTYHGDWDPGYGGIVRRFGVAFHNLFLVDEILSHANIIISPSHNYIKSSRYLNKYEDRCVTIPNGINGDKFKIIYSKEECRNILGLPQDMNILLFLGYLTPYKGPEVLVKSLPIILEREPNTLLLFAGKGAMRFELEHLSIRLGVEKNIKFVGFVDEDLKALYYKAADVFCLTSTMSTECYPLAILEAMACGLPVVASNIGGIPDAVNDDKNGLLVPPGDSKKLANAIIHLLDNEDRMKSMGKDGLKKIENYSWDKIAKETEQVYARCL